MKTDCTKYFLLFFVLALFTWTLSCSGRSENKTVSSGKLSSVISEEPALKLIKMDLPEENSEFKLGSSVPIVLSLENSNRVPDSVIISFDGRYIATLSSPLWEYTIPQGHTLTTGRKSLKVTPYKGGKSRNSVTRFMIIYSDIVPKKYGYKVIKTYPHSRDAFTQGLVYDKGVLFEGTGQETGSSLREVELETGNVKRQLNLDAALFGEGITLYQDHIFQVTWTSKVGFVYEKETFNVINKIYYPTQGWGLTTMGDRIVMSDGTNVLYFMEPGMFTVTFKIEVYDNENKVDSLNELEYIDGEIWANIWMTDKIVRIDPESGKVLGYINLKGLLPDALRRPETDVLNGIAWDKEGKRIFVTGKRWPELYQIAVTE